MADKQTFECENCGKKAEETSDQARAPECCGQPMKVAEPLKACTMSTTAEHSRFDDVDEPCDDGRAGS